MYINIHPFLSPLHHMSDIFRRLDIVQPVLLPMIPRRQLGLLASTNRMFRTLIDKIGRNFTFTTKPGDTFDQHTFTIYSYNGEKLMIRTRHPYTPSIEFKLDDEWFCSCLSEMDKAMPYNTERRTRYMPLALYNAGCKIRSAINELKIKEQSEINETRIKEQSAINETKIWFSNVPMGKVVHKGRLVDEICVTLFLGCNLGKGGFTVSSADVTFLTEGGRVLTTER